MDNEPVFPADIVKCQRTQRTFSAATANFPGNVPTCLRNMPLSDHVFLGIHTSLRYPWSFFAR